MIKKGKKGKKKKKTGLGLKYRTKTCANVEDLYLYIGFYNE